MENTHGFDALEQEWSVSREDIDGFRRDGHLLLKQLASEEDIGRIREACRREIARLDDGLRLQVMNVWEKDAAVKAFVFARKFSRIAADLLGVDGVRLYFDQVFFKKPGAGAMPLHQANQFMLELDPDSVISMWMPLTDIPGEKGPLSYVAGSHLHEKLRSAKNPLLAAMRLGLSEKPCGPMQAGDASFHTGWTLHGAYGNDTEITREMLIITWFAEGARITDPADSAGRNPQLQSLFRGLEPGGKAQGRRLPLLFYRPYRDVVKLIHQAEEDAE
ncbi:phytanoyl-CoA dioxygenase family protein [Paenibacillus chitinolyticus]